MELQQVIQNTAEWHDLRKDKIGASEAPIIMGVSEYKTLRELWIEKVNPQPKKESENTYVQDKGHRLEKKIRAMIEIDLMMDFPPITAVSEELDFLMASLDGYNAEAKLILECKYVGQDDFKLVESGQCLPQYFPQVQHQLLVTNAECCILAACTEDKDNEKDLKYTYVKVFPDDKYISEKLLPALCDFKSLVDTKTDPGYGPRDVMDMSDSEELQDALTRYDLINKEAEEVSKRLEKVKSEVFKLAKHTKVKCNGITVYEIQNKDSVKTEIDYDKFLADRGLTLPPEYVKTTVSKCAKSKKITFPKPEKSDDKKPADSIVPGASIVLPKSQVDDLLKTDPVSTPPKRKRRTKAEMEAAKAAL